MIDQVKAALAALREGDGDGAIEILEAVLGELEGENEEHDGPAVVTYADGRRMVLGARGGR